MFISQEEADGRLYGDRNLLKDKSSARPGPLPKEKSATDIVLPCLDGPDALDKLTSIIKNGGSDPKRAHYVGNRPAQKAIAEVDALLGPSFTSKTFGLTPPQAQSYGDGLQTPDKRRNKEIKEVKEHVDLIKLGIARAASLKLKKIVDCMNDEKIEAIDSPLKLAQMGKDVAAIVHRVSSNDAREDDRAIFHIYRPDVAEAREYNIVNIMGPVPAPQPDYLDGVFSKEVEGESRVEENK